MRTRAASAGRFRVSRWIGWTAYGLLGCLALGCTGPLFRGESTDVEIEQPPSPNVKLIADVANPHGMNFVKVEAVSLVTSLDGTGADPAPTPQRATLLAEMKRRKVESPGQLLASPNTALVVVRTFLRPGIQEGERLDVEVRIPTRSETSSLRGGRLLSTRLTEMAVLGQQIRQGRVLALASGPVLVDPTASADDESPMATQGRVLGGGIATKSRPLGLVLDDEHSSVRLSQQVSKAVNGRFYTYRRGRKIGVAKAKTDEFVELIVHPRYQYNVARFIKVVRNLAIQESPSARLARLALLERQLADPLTAGTAAIRLEAIGDDQAKEILAAATKAADAEVRFYAAEALAYLDDTNAVPALIQAARDEPAFRVHALAALSAMEDMVAYDSLRELLNRRSAETRYGAFRALWAMNRADPLVRGEILGEDEFGFHVLTAAGPPMIHVTRSFRPEIVFFGREHHLRLPVVLEAGKHILVNGLRGEDVTVSRFAPGEPTQQRVVSTDVEDVIRAIVDLGGTYPDVVQALQKAKAEGALASRFRIDALPEIGRRYERSLSDDSPSTQPSSGGDRLDLATPRPSLFSRRRS